MNGQPMQMLPAFEQLKLYVVSNLFDMTENYADIQKNFYLKKYPKVAVAGFKAQILKFYRFIKPKIAEYSSQIEDKSLQDEYYGTFMKIMDGYVDSPRTLKLLEAMAAYDFLVRFCEDSGLTKLTQQTVKY